MKRICLSIICVIALLMAMAVPMSAQVVDNESLWLHIAGDVDRNWTVNSSDVRDIYCVVSGESSNSLSKAADVNDDGKVDMFDTLAAMCTVVGQTATTLIKPTVTERETALEGEELAFQANDRHQYNADSRRMPDLWVVQSYEELVAAYNHSYAQQDFTVNYNEAYFEDNALIIWATHHADYGLYDICVKRVIKSGNELCLVRELKFLRNEPFDCFARFLVEISKEDLADIDTVTLYTEYDYRE